MMALINENFTLIIVLAVLALILTLLWNQREKVPFWWLNFTYGFPIVGSLSRMSKNLEYNDAKGYFYSEKELCNDYYDVYHSLEKSAEDYDRATSYLDLLGEKDRKPMSLAMWGLIIVLVVVEAMGFAYILASFLDATASEDTRKLMSYGVGLLISVPLVKLTHATGHVLYINSKIKTIRMEYVRDHNENRPELKPRYDIGLDTQFDDIEDPRYLRLLSRIAKADNGEAKSSWLIPLVTLFFIVAIAVGSTYVRGESMAQEMIDRQNVEQVSMADEGWGEESATVSDKQSESDNSIQQDVQSHFQEGSWATFMILAVVFVFIQIVGVLIGFQRGFAGEDSKKAYAIRGGFVSKTAFINYYEYRRAVVARVAEANLNILQQKMRRNIKEDMVYNTKHSPTMHFDGCLQEQLEQDRRRRENRLNAA